MVDYKIKTKWQQQQQKNPFISKLLLFMLFITAIESELGHVLSMDRVSKKKKVQNQLEIVSYVLY